MKKKTTDKEAWEKFINSNEKILDKDQSPFKKKIFYIEKNIDLHGYTLDEANIEVEKFILDCFEKKVSKINIITGKGTRSKNKHDPYKSKNLSILKYSVPNYINSNNTLMSKILKIDFEEVNNPSKGSFSIILKKNV